MIAQNRRELLRRLTPAPVAILTAALLAGCSGTSCDELAALQA